MAKTTVDRVKKVTAEVLKKSAKNITDDARFVEDLAAESIQSLELVAALEEEFGVEMNEKDALRVTSVGAAAAFIDRLLAKKK
jgi:acyl carrier protein